MIKKSDMAWAKFKTNDMLFEAGLHAIPEDEREAFLTGMRLVIWEAEFDKKTCAGTPKP